MRFSYLFYVSFILMALLWTKVSCDEDMPEGVSDMEEEEIVTVSVEKAKREGWLPWEKWYDEHDYDEWKKTVLHYFTPLDAGNAFFRYKCKNVTDMSSEKYAYYIGGGN